MFRMTTLAGGLVMMAAAGAAHADNFFLNYEAPGVENSTAVFTTVGVETFDTRISGAGFSTDFGTAGAISARYTPVQINRADRFGGAGGVGSYAVTFARNPYTLHFTADPTRLPDGVNYFGYWLSALDEGNQVSFYRGGVSVGTLTPAQVLLRVRSDRRYYDNPNAGFTGQNAREPYVFVNFYDTDGSFDEIRFSQSTPRGGYESDNHTVGYYTAVGGTPEPASWALLMTGFGVVGSRLRRRGITSLAA